MPGDVAVFPKIAINLFRAYKELVRINRHKTLPYDMRGDDRKRTGAKTPFS
jgi:hypothetical protein